MKLNIYQKLILLLYCGLFMYFTILHVPFKNYSKGEVIYDSLFSNNGNLDLSRFISIVVVISVLAALLFWLFHNISIPKSRLLPKHRNRILVLGSICIIMAVTATIFITKRQIEEKQETKIYAADSAAVDVVDTAIKPGKDTDPLKLRAELETSKEELKAETCTTANALKNFKSYMKFNYPDWKIYGNPVVQEQSDCSYRIQFTTIDPHIRLEKEIIVVEISFHLFSNQYSITNIRGTLY